jgi:hypothetical protein
VSGPEPSWTTALSEADATLRHLRQATAALERLSREARALREQGEATARLDVAHALTDGPDGGALNALVTATADERASPEARRTAAVLLERITGALGLRPLGSRGELLRLGQEDLAELDLRGSPALTNGTERALYCVVRAGWLMDEHIVARPVVEAVAEDAVAQSCEVN